MRTLQCLKDAALFELPQERQAARAGLEQAVQCEHGGRHQPVPPRPYKTPPQAVAGTSRQVWQVKSRLCAPLSFLHTRQCCLQLRDRTRQMEQVQSLSSSLPMDGALWRVLGWTDSAWR